MLCTLRDLESRNVVNLLDGRILGSVCDMEINTDCGRVTALLVQGNHGFWSFGGETIRICWENVKCIGEDAILVEYRREAECCPPRSPKRCGWLFGMLNL